jgi:hypothetical protein
MMATYKKGGKFLVGHLIPTQNLLWVPLREFSKFGIAIVLRFFKKFLNIGKYGFTIVSSRILHSTSEILQGLFRIYERSPNLFRL